MTSELFIVLKSKGRFNMKKQYTIFAVVIIALGLLTALAPYTFAKVCDTTEKVMKCHWTGRVEFFLGLAVAALGILKLLPFSIAKENGFQAGVNLGIIADAIGIILVPTVIIGVCGMKTMHCHAVTQPVLIVLGILTLVSSVSQTVILWKKR